MFRADRIVIVAESAKSTNLPVCFFQQRVVFFHPFLHSVPQQVTTTLSVAKRCTPVTTGGLRIHKRFEDRRSLRSLRKRDTRGGDRDEEKREEEKGDSISESDFRSDYQC